MGFLFMLRFNESDRRNSFYTRQDPRGFKVDGTRLRRAICPGDSTNQINATPHIFSGEERARSRTGVPADDLKHTVDYSTVRKMFPCASDFKRLF